MNWHLSRETKQKLRKTLAEKFFDNLTIFSNGLLVANKLGLTAVAAVGVSSLILFSFNVLTNSLTSVTNTEVSNNLGEEKVLKSTQSTNGVVIVQGFYLTISLTLLLSSFTFAFAPQMFSACGADQATVEAGTPYLRILAGLYLIDGLRRQAKSALQGMDDYKSALVSSFWMNGVHIALAIAAIHFLHLGLEGVAWATWLSQVVGLLLLVRPLKRQAFQKGIPWKFERTIFKTMFVLSKDTMVQMICVRASLIIYGSVLIYISKEAYVAQNIIADVVTFIHVVMNAFIAVMTTETSKLYGERKALHDQLHDTHSVTTTKDEQKQEQVQALEEKEKELVRTVTSFLGLTCLFMGTLGILQYVACDWIIRLYTSDPATIEASYKMSLTAALYIVPYTCYVVMHNGGLASVKDRKGSRNSVLFATLLWTASLWVIRDWGLDAILISKILFDILRGLLVCRRFYSKRWSRCPSKNCALSQ